MCGIVGIIYSDLSRKCSKEKIQAMNDLITHRGPDDSGIYIENGMGFGHRRLSIIDLDSGHQPMLSPDGDLCIVFNGEIYNYIILRKELEKHGYVFKTNSDTEVILQAYRHYGTECAKKLNGIFSFAIWDTKNKTAYLARDHMGVKPLYYFKNNEVFIFSSEVKSLFESGYLHPECDFHRLPEYFIFRHVAGENSLFKNVKSLLPGNQLFLNNGQIEISEFWNPFQNNEYLELSFDESLEKLDCLINDAIDMQMVSDVPLGTFCSGGVDSSLVTAIASQKTTNSINTFSVGFNEAEYDETKYARMVSDKYGTTHHELVLDDLQFSEYLPSMIFHNDEPLNFANSIQIYAVSKLAKEFVTVVLTGEGADELFGGYPRYQIPKIVHQLQNIPGLLKWLVRQAMGGVKDHRIKKLQTYLSESMEDVLIYNTATLNKQNYNKTWQSFINDKFDYRDSVVSELENIHSWSGKTSRLDQKCYLLSILNRQDKMSMAASLESRVPLLDYRLVEFANSLPEKYKQNNFKTKMILKKLSEKYIPRDVIYRRKSGFGVPLSLWFRKQGGLGGLAKDVFEEVDLPELDEILDIKSIFARHQSAISDDSEIIWTTLNYALWKKAFSIN